jgi:subfamily B ATP-binding cassette protein MsbA
LTLAFNILTPAKAISKASYSVKNGLAAAERVFEVLEVENEIISKKNAIDKNTFDSDITIKNVNFKYEEETVLKDFSLQVKKGQTIALVGQSGSGKSTIANLLTRFYDVNEGTISIDGTDIKDINLQSLRGLMGLVTQDSILFNDTIKANISLGKETATDDEIIEALKIANAYEFVKDLPKGIHTNIGDSGNKLSGGQKQRLSIARAVLKNPPIMILDEATSALDTESEKFVQVALENMMQNRTSIVIAHRLSTIQKADTIVVMQKGKIVEQGTHDELITLNGMYNKLVTMQSFE